MHRSNHIRHVTIAAVLLTSAGVAQAHVSISSGPAAANKSQKITFGVGHGCDGADTLSITVSIPTSVISVRALRSDFSTPSFVRDATSNEVTSVTWQKPDAELLADDSGYYELVIRAKVPNTPFTRLQFNVTQVCRDSAGVETTVQWDGIENDAPMLTVVPAKTAGWNRFVLAATESVTDEDLPVYFGDSLIVWRGTAAYTPNAVTLTLIEGTPGVSVLTGGLQPNDEIWVKY